MRPLNDDEVREISNILASLPESHRARIALARRRTMEQIEYLLIGKPDLLDRVRRVHEIALRRFAASEGPSIPENLSCCAANQERIAERVGAWQRDA